LNWYLNLYRGKYNIKLTNIVAMKNLGGIKNDQNGILNNGVICPIPWIHFVAYPNGTAQICTHQSNYSTCTGNIFDNSFEEIMNHENLRKLRSDMLTGKKNSLCSNCHAFEKASKGFSPRTTYLQKYTHHLLNGISNTKVDGEFDYKYFKFIFWNFKISGVCNLKCRTCHPHFSTSIYTEQKNNNLLSDIDLLDFMKIRKNLPLVMTEILKHIEHVEEIHFVGGEPMLMNEHWQILEALIENKRTDVRLAYHTNLTKLIFKNKHVFDFWKQIKASIWVSPSIDAYNEKNEYIRDGANWETLNDKLDKVLELRKELKNLTVVPTITVSVLNVYYIDELIDYLYSKNVDNVNFNIVRFPSYFHISLLPNHLKKDALKKLEKCIEKNNLEDDIFNLFKSEIFNAEVQNNRKDLLKQLKDETLKLDEIRCRNFPDIFPDLYDLVK